MPVATLLVDINIDQRICVPIHITHLLSAEIAVNRHHLILFDNREKVGGRRLDTFDSR